MPNYLHIKDSAHQSHSINDGLSWLYNITANATEVGYTESSTIEIYEELFCKLADGKDVLESAQDALFILNEIKLLFDAKAGADEAAKWANCTAAEKDALAKLFLVSSAHVAERIADTNTRKFYFAKLVAASIPARQDRVNKAIAYIGEEMSSKADRVDLFNTVKSAMSSYISSGDADLSDYFNSAGSYVGSGFAEEKAYFTQAIIDAFNDIVVNGN